LHIDIHAVSKSPDSYRKQYCV